MTENLLADDVQPVGVISPVGCARGPEVFVEVAVFREREGDRRIRVKRRRLHDAEAGLHRGRVVGGDIVRNYGGEVKLASFVEGHSSTTVISRLQSSAAGADGTDA